MSNDNTMEMPGTIGGAKVVFPEENTSYTVKMDVRFVFAVEAKTYDEAVEKAKHFQQTMDHEWGLGEDVSWVDHYVVKEIVEKELDV